MKTRLHRIFEDLSIGLLAPGQKLHNSLSFRWVGFPSCLRGNVQSIHQLLPWNSHFVAAALKMSQKGQLASLMRPSQHRHSVAKMALSKLCFPSVPNFFTRQAPSPLFKAMSPFCIKGLTRGLESLDKMQAAICGRGTCEIIRQEEWAHSSPNYREDVEDARISNTTSRLQPGKCTPLCL